MTNTTIARRARWALPVVVASGVVAAAVVFSNGAGASEQPNLPNMTAAQLIRAVEHARPQPFSGTVVENASLGLPDLPAADLPGGQSIGLTSLLTGSHTARVWYGGPSDQRVAVLAQLAERDVIHHGRDVWTYDSNTNHVTHLRLPADVGTQSHSATADAAPPDIARQVLRAVRPSTAVTVDKTAVVAGRSAYQLDLVPRDSRTLVGSIRIAIDAATSTPLQLQVFARGATTPALEIGFTRVSFSAPAASVFAFTPPAGATVSQHGSSPSDGSARPPSTKSDGSQARPQLIGHGWTAVAELSNSPLSGSDGQLLDSVSQTVPEGHLITTSLVTILVTHDGRTFIGSVSADALRTVARTGQAL